MLGIDGANQKFKTDGTSTLKLDNKNGEKKI